MSRLAIVTATTNLVRAEDCIRSWIFGDGPRVIVIRNGPARQPNELPVAERLDEDYGAYILGTAHYLGSVPAFRLGVDHVLDRMPEVEVIACLHDDLEIHDRGWVETVLRHFDRQPACGLAGFGGAIGLGADDLYQTPYDPMQLARKGFRSNLTNAEAHGARSLLSERVACLDGFSQIGRRAFFEGYTNLSTGARAYGIADTAGDRPWTYLESLGVVHHFYDGLLGCLAARAGWETWYLPVSCTHHGGRTAVGDRGYQAWAETQVAGGDQGFWQEAHRLGYDSFRDVLPLRV